MAIAACIACATAIAYIPALRAGYVWDDAEHFLANPLMTDPDGWRGIWSAGSAIYYPIVLSVWRAMHGLFGFESALPYHAINVVLHVANALMLGKLAERIGLRGGWIAAALFALHPVHVESVAWCTELKNTLSGAFFLASLHAWLRFGEAAMRRAAWYAAALGLFALALCSKPSTVMLPAVLVLLAWRREGAAAWRGALATVPFFAFSMAASAYTVWEQKFHSNARGAEWDISLLERLLMAGRIPWFYLGKLAWPHPLAFIYPRWAPDAASALWWSGGIALAAVLALLAWKAHRWGRGPLAALLAYVALLFPVMTFFNVYFFRFSYVADHFAYLASMVPIVCAAHGAAIAADRLSGKARNAALGCAVAAIAVLASLTFLQARIYKDEETLWLATLERNPAAWIAHSNLGYDYREAGKTDLAAFHLQRAIELDPLNWEANSNYGILLFDAGRAEEAIPFHEVAVRSRPDNAALYNNLANALGSAGRIDEALAAYDRSLALDATDPETYKNSARFLLESGRADEALARLEAARMLAPDDPLVPQMMEIVRRARQE